MADGHRTDRTSSTTYGSLAGLAMVTAGEALLAFRYAPEEFCLCLIAIPTMTC
jgi:hypothetical protein